MPDDKSQIDHFAEALLSLGHATTRLEAIHKDISGVADIVADSGELRRFLGDPHVEKEGKHTALTELFEGRIGSEVLLLLHILQEEDRLRDLPLLAEVFSEKIAALSSKSTGELVTATPLSDARLSQIEKEAGRILGQKVSLHVRVDPSLLGGMRLRVGNYVLDDTIDYHLEQMKQTLLG